MSKNSMPLKSLKELAEQYSIQQTKNFEEAKKSFEQGSLLSEDGYPTQEALNLVSAWYDCKYSAQSQRDLFSFIKSMWYMPSYGWHESERLHEYRESEKVTRYEISTVGWSGNEAIIKALEKNESIWHSTWYSSKRGGHFIFEIAFD